MPPPADRARRGLLALTALCVVATAVAVGGLARLRFDDDYRRLFQSDDPEFRRLEELASQFGGDEHEVLVLLEARDVTAPAAIAAVAAAHRAAREVAGVREVWSITSGRLGLPTGEELRADRQARGRLLAADLAATVIVVRLDDERRSVAETEPVLTALRQAVERAATPAGLRVSLAGAELLRAEIVRSIQADQVTFNVVGAVAVSLVAWLVFRRLAAVALLGLSAVAGVTWTLGAMGWAGQPIDVLTNATPQLVLVVGFSTAVHLLRSLQRHRRSGLPRLPAALGAVREVGLPCALSSLTTAIGFASLALTPLPILQRFGLWCAAGVGLSLIAVLSVAALLAVTKLGDLAVAAPSGRTARFDRAMSRLLDAVVARPRTVVVAALATTLLFGLSLLALRPDYRYSEYLPEDRPTIAALRAFERHFGGSAPLHVLVEWQGETPPRLTEALAEVETLLAGTPELGAPTSLLTVLAALDPGAAPAALLDLVPFAPAAAVTRFYRPDLGRALVTARAPDVGAAALAPRLDRLRAGLAELEAERTGLRLHLTGLLPLTSHVSLRMIDVLAKSLGSAAVAIAIVLGATLGSVRLGLASVPPNALPIFGLGALLWATGRPLQFASASTFNIALGIAVDDTIHVLAAYRKERAAAHGVEEALRRAYARVGVPVVLTTVLMSIGFGTLLMSELPLLRLAGGLGCFAFAVALIGDLVVLPAMVLVLEGGRR